MAPAVRLASAYALVGWAFFTGLLVALGDVLLRPISAPATPGVVVGLAALTSLAVGALTIDYLRRAGRTDLGIAFAFGTCLAAIGLALDAVLLLATQFDYPNVGKEKMPTLAVLLLLGYAVAAAVPPVVAWIAGRAGITMRPVERGRLESGTPAGRPRRL
jgi:hypothetical protein